MRYEDFDVIKNFDKKTGPDTLSLQYDTISYFGIINKSPVEQRLIGSFNYRTIYTNFSKPYKAHWIISESKLFLGFVNGVINGKRLFTTDIFPEFAGQTLLHFFYFFSGQLEFYSRDLTTSQVENLNWNRESLLLNIKKGILISAECKK